MTQNAIAVHSNPNSLNDFPLVRALFGAAPAIGARTEQAGQHLIQYGLVLVLVWMGLLKFTAFEAAAIEPMINSHALLAWLYGVFSVQATSNLIGTIEVLAGVLLALRYFSPLAGAAGGALAIGTFALTLSFMLTIPPVWQASAGGFPYLSVMPGQFLIKDVLFLAAAIWAFGNALKDVRPVR